MAVETQTEEKKVDTSQDVQTSALLFMMESLRELKNEVAALKSSMSTGQRNVTVLPAKGSGNGGGRQRQPGSPHIDTETGVVYKSKASAGKALFPEFKGMKLKDGRIVKMHGWIFHDIIQLAPGRLIPYEGSKGHLEVDADYVIEHVSDPEQPENGAEKSETEEPKSEAPKTEEPKAEEPKSEEPKSEEPKSEAPKQPQTQQRPQLQKHFQHKK